jgi:mitogen-activated protein kinase kinase kinase
MFHIGIATKHPPLPDPQELSELGIDFIRKSLTLDPVTRPTTVDLLNHPWMKDLEACLIEMNEDNEEYNNSTSNHHHPSSSSTSSSAFILSPQQQQQQQDQEQQQEQQEQQSDPDQKLFNQIEHLSLAQKTALHSLPEVEESSDS